MLSEKQAIEKLKKIRQDTINANECDLSNNDFKEEIEAYDAVLNIIDRLQKENEEKDKQIDLIIEEYEFYDRINFKNFCEEQLRKNKCIKDCKNCAKHFFENKAKGENN